MHMVTETYQLRDADLGGDCNDGYYENPHYDRCPVCGQRLDYSE